MSTSPCSLRPAALAALTTVTLTTVAIVGPGIADAHVSISSGPAQADKSQKITFSVGHGCEGFDTVKVRVLIPAGLTSVRALPGPGDFDQVTVERGTDDAVTAVVWEKPAEARLDGDYGYYDLTLRGRVANAPFTTLAFTIEQTCLDADGDPILVTWGGDDAAHLTVVPQRRAGWNRVVLAAPVLEADVATYFGDALIVWRGNAAYSPNAATSAQIGMTAGVTLLTGDLAAGDELWVKY